MSNTQYIFLPRARVPGRAALQAAIDGLKLPLTLDPAFTPFEDSGFSPCELLGKTGTGFEIFYEAAADVVGEDDALRDLAGNNDFCISLTWHSSQEDLACVTIASAAYAASFGGVVSYEGNEAETPESLLKQAADRSALEKFGEIERLPDDEVRQLFGRLHFTMDKFVGDSLAFGYVVDKQSDSSSEVAFQRGLGGRWFIGSW